LKNGIQVDLTRDNSFDWNQMVSVWGNDPKNPFLLYLIIRIIEICKMAIYWGLNRICNGLSMFIPYISSTNWQIGPTTTKI
jgi:hypothetical protein